MKIIHYQYGWQNNISIFKGNLFTENGNLIGFPSLLSIKHILKSKFDTFSTFSKTFH